MWVSEPEDIPGYFVFLGAMCVVVSVLAFFLFKDWNGLVRVSFVTVWTSLRTSNEGSG